MYLALTIVKLYRSFIKKLLHALSQMAWPIIDTSLTLTPDISGIICGYICPRGMLEHNAEGRPAFYYFPLSVYYK